MVDAPAAAPPLDDGELDAWLHLLQAPGVGRGAARRLLARFGSPQAAIAAPVAELCGCIDAPAAMTLALPPEGHAARLAATLAWRGAAPERRVMVLGEADYPPLLLHTADPPLLLYLQGRSELLRARSLAIVGSRHPSAQGRDNAHGFAQALSQQGWTIVSGMAAGIDAAAHEGALAAADAPDSGSTIAVIGTGIDRVYPASHRQLAHRIAEQGLIVSELPLGAPPLATHFPQRNRLIAGLTRGTLVVEAALRSGSLITARLAAEAGREVMAVPGSILSKLSQGCHALIRDGAALVESVAQVLETLEDLPPLDLPPPSAPVPALTPADPDDAVLRALGHDPLTLDALIERCGWPAPALTVHLLTLELDGLIARLPGGLYQRRQHV
jgi:DNA processing protein